MTSTWYESGQGRAATLLWLIALLFMMPAALAQEEQIQVEVNEGPRPERSAVTFRSPEDDFTVDFPEGCDRIRATAPSMTQQQDSLSEQDVLYAYCDRGKEPGQGASVTVFYAMTAEDGRSAGPADVVELIGKALVAKGVQVVHQTEIEKEFPGGALAEGTDIFAQEPGGAGQVWIRGLLVDGVIYLLEAWNQAGGLWEDPDYQNFFNSFKLIE